MKLKLFQFALVVRDYDEAIDYYTEILGFELKEDTILSPEKRWVVVSPGHQASCHILLTKAATEEQRNSIGNQTGGRVFLFLHTDNALEYLEILNSNHVRIIRPISFEEYGKVFVFADLYGNLWDVIEPHDLTHF